MTGSNLGGGSTVNWTNCLRTNRLGARGVGARARARGPGRAGLRPPPRRRLRRASASTTTARTSTGPTLRMKEGCEQARLGLRARSPATPTASATTPTSPGYMGFGDVTGRQARHAEDLPAGRGRRRRALRRRTAASSACSSRTAARPASRAPTSTTTGRARARRRARADGRRWPRARSTRRRVLLRSGIGGPAAGDYLRLHPGRGVPAASTTSRRRRWWGAAADRAVSAQFADLEDGYGFLIETAHATPGVTGSAVPWETGRQHKEHMAQAPMTVGAGPPDPRPRPRPGDDRRRRQPGPLLRLTDALDVANFRRGLAELARLHEAAGRAGDLHAAPQAQRWSRATGEDIEVFAAARRTTRALDPYEHATFSLHHMGIGADGQATPPRRWPTRGASCTTRPGVWIGDASAFPTASRHEPDDHDHGPRPPHRRRTSQR